MCGIIGYASKASRVDADWLKAGVNEIKHRGPDDSGIWISESAHVGFGHRRLSILDLSPLGHQPLVNDALGLSLIFNGEIYNFLEIKLDLISLGHSFISTSDTEVLLKGYAQWGSNILERLNGMFAFAIYDSRQNILFLARDRSGEKPLFFYYNSVEIYFCSELKGLLLNSKFDKKIDLKSLDLFLGLGYVPGSSCIAEGFNKLAPGTAMIFDLNNGKLSNWKYWTPPDFIGGMNEDDLEQRLEELLEDAVAKQLIADVPVGVLLSGGLDSSLITALASRHSSKVKTFSIRFPGHGKMDESEHARLIARYFNTEHIELSAEPQTADLITVLSKQFDEPIIDSSMIPTFMVSQLVKKHCSVALGGDGGDELFGGYSHYSRVLFLEKYMENIPYWLRSSLGKFAGEILPLGFKGRNYFIELGADFNSGVPLLASYFDIKARTRIMRNFDSSFIPSIDLISNVGVEGDLLERLTRADFRNYLAEDILVKVDRSSMLNSLEVRAPFLDHRIIEFAFSKVPSNLKSSTSDRKILLKRLATRLLPPEFDLKRKQGFSIPLNTWLKSGPYKELFWDVLTSNDCIFEKKYVIDLLQSIDKGYSNSERLFGLVNFELWRKHYNFNI